MSDNTVVRAGAERMALSTASAAERPASPARRLDVQGLRAVAVLLVVAFHAGLPVPGGFMGVDVFFVISGYVIIALLYWEVSSTGRISLSGFFSRRARRIMPALSLVTTLTVVGAWFWLSPLGTQQVTATTARAASLFYANWSIRATSGDYFAEAATVNPLLHTWSLSVEEQFYMVFPSLLALTWLVARRRAWRGRLTVVWLLAILTVASLVASLVFTGPLASHWSDATTWAFYGSMFRVWEFAIGGILAVAVRKRPALPSAVLTAIGILGAAMVAVSVFVVSGATPWPGPWTVPPVLGTAAIIFAGSGLTRGVVPGLASRPMVWLGDLSYSLYLWHWPAIVFTTVLTAGSPTWIRIAAFGSLLPAWIAFQLIEQPIRTSGARGRKAFALGAVCIAIPVVAAGVLLHHADSYVREAEHAVSGGKPRLGYPQTPSPPDDPFQAAILAQRGQWEVYDEPCLGGGKDEPVGSCVFFDAPGRPRAVLIGDSHAGAYAPGFIAAARELGYSVEVITSSGCPFVDVPVARGGAVLTDCETREKEIWDRLEADPPALVALANRSPRFVSSPIRLADELEPGFNAPCVSDAAGQCLAHDDAVKAWTGSLRDTAGRIDELGVPFVLLQTVPEQAHGLEHCVVGTTVDFSCLETPRSVSWDRRRDVISAEDAVAADLGFPTFDPFDRFCDETTCHQVFDGLFYYRNDDHLNPTGSESLTDPLRKLLASVAPVPEPSPQSS